jgi:hypothetical protein
MLLSLEKLYKNANRSVDNFCMFLSVESTLSDLGDKQENFGAVLELNPL